MPDLFSEMVVVDALASPVGVYFLCPSCKKERKVNDHRRVEGVLVMGECSYYTINNTSSNNCAIQERRGTTRDLIETTRRTVVQVQA